MNETINQAATAYQQGDPEPAFALLKALPDEPEARLQALVIVVNAAIHFDRINEAIEGLQQLMHLQPDESRWQRMSADALNRRGAQRREAGDAKAALEDFDSALHNSLMHPLANFNAALAMRDLGDLRGALRHIGEHLHGNPQDAEAALMRAELLAETGRVEQAEEALEQVLADPACPQGLRLAMGLARIGRLQAAADVLELQGSEAAGAPGMEVAERIRQQGDSDATRRAFAAVIGACRSRGQPPPLRAALAQALHIDPLPADTAQMQLDREAFSAGLQQIETDWPNESLARLPAELEQASWSNFYLAYQGKDDCALQSSYGDFLARATRSLAPSLDPPLERRRDGPARVGFLSSSFRECTVGNYFGRWPRWLQEAGFEVHLFQLGPQRDATTARIATGLHRFVFHDGSLNELAEQVRSCDLDLLIYPEIGMDMRLLPLAATRLARCQAAAWGHPTTTGLPSIDVFLSCAGMEPADAPAHYRERLHLLPGLGVDYPLVAASSVPDDIELPMGVRVLVPQSGFKLHPDNDALMAELAATVPEAVFLLFTPQRPRWRERLMTRLGHAFERSGADPDNQLHWLPQVQRPQYLQINRQCDLMLDSLHWSGGNTSLDALVSGLPLATCNGRFMRGRQSAAMLAQLGLAENLVAADRDALLKLATDLLRDPEQRRSLSSRITNALPKLFDSDQAKQRFVALAEELCHLV